MKCSKCGFILPGDSEFCQYCGVKLNQEVTSVDLIKDAVANPVPETLIEQLEPFAVSAADTVAEPVVVEDAHELINASENLAAPVIVADTPLLSNNLSDVQTEASIVSTPTVDPEESPDVAPHPKKAKYCKRCGGLIDHQTKKCSKCGKQYFRVKRSLVFLLILALLGSVGLNIGQYLQIASHEETISTQERILKIRKDLFENTNEKFNSLKSDLTLLSQGNIGHASSNFKVDKSVIILNNKETKKIKLTTSWSGGGDVSVDYTHRTVATVSFDDDSWYNSTTLTVKPLFSGSTVVTFSNDANSQTFKILIIVTD